MCQQLFCLFFGPKSKKLANSFTLKPLFSFNQAQRERESEWSKFMSFSTFPLYIFFLSWPVTSSLQTQLKILSKRHKFQKVECIYYIWEYGGIYGLLSRNMTARVFLPVVRKGAPLRFKACKLGDPLSTLLIMKEHLFDSS